MPQVSDAGQPHATVPDLAHALNCDRRTVRRLIHSGEFPNAIKLPGRGDYRVPQADVIAFLERQRVADPPADLVADPPLVRIGQGDFTRDIHSSDL